MSHRPVFHPNLGPFFKHLREARGLGLREAASRALRRRDERPELSAISLGKLDLLEKGKTKNPDPQILRGLAALYDIPFHTLFVEFLRARYGLSDADLDLIRPAAGVEHGSGVANGGLQIDGRTEDRARSVESAPSSAVSVRPTADPATDLIDVAAVLADLRDRVISISTALLAGGEDDGVDRDEPQDARHPRSSRRRASRAGAGKAR